MDVAVFCKVAKCFELAKITVCKSKRVLKDSKEAQEHGDVFKLLTQHWSNLEGKVLPVAFSLKGTAQGNVVQELVSLFRTLLRDQQDPEHAVHAFRCLVGHMPPAVRSAIQVSTVSRTSSKKIKD